MQMSKVRVDLKAKAIHPFDPNLSSDASMRLSGSFSGEFWIHAVRSVHGKLMMDALRHSCSRACLHHTSDKCRVLAWKDPSNAMYYSRMLANYYFRSNMTNRDSLQATATYSLGVTGIIRMPRCYTPKGIPSFISPRLSESLEHRNVR